MKSALAHLPDIYIGVIAVLAVLAFLHKGLKTFLHTVFVWGCGVLALGAFSAKLTHPAEVLANGTTIPITGDTAVVAGQTATITSVPYFSPKVTLALLIVVLLGGLFAAFKSFGKKPPMPPMPEGPPEHDEHGGGHH